MASWLACQTPDQVVRVQALAWAPGGVLRDPNDGDVRRIFLGSKFSIPGFFWVGEFGRYFIG